MERIPLIIGNWKMHKTALEGRAFVEELIHSKTKPGRSVGLAVPFTSLSMTSVAKKAQIMIGAQNMHDQEEGAFTGEISARMLKEVGAQFVLIGHSERRQYFAETDAFIQRKVKRAVQEQLLPILCIGENAQERKEGRQWEVFEQQLATALEGLEQKQPFPLVIAYEPVWAIGTGQSATPLMAQEVHHWIRKWLEKRFNQEIAGKISLLYGGSVKPSTIGSLMDEEDIDGALVGGASLDVKSFCEIINY